MRYYISFFAMALILILTTSQVSAPTQQKQKMVTITLTENTWRVLFFAMDKADVPHPTIRALQDSLFTQFNQQLADTTKKK